MSQGYSNVPKNDKETGEVIQTFGYYSNPIEFNSMVLAAMKGYFVSRDFGEVSAEAISIIIMTQAKQDGYNPMLILDTLKGLNNVELSGLVSEILNYNRFKSSSLGYAPVITPNKEVSRWIIDDGMTQSARNIDNSYIKDENSQILTDENGDPITLDY